jgi:hypothetical protein
MVEFCDCSLSHQAPKTPSSRRTPGSIDKRRYRKAWLSRVSVELSMDPGVRRESFPAVPGMTVVLLSGWDSSRWALIYWTIETSHIDTPSISQAPIPTI